MLGGVLKLAFSFSILFLLITLLWQASITDALPTLVSNDDLVRSDGDASRLFAMNSHTGANVVKRSLHTTVDQSTLINRSSSPSHNRRLKSISRSNFSSPHLFQSTGTYNKNLRTAKRIKAALDNRLKRFRMLDQDEFQEMLKSLSQQQTAEEQAKASNGVDTIGGMELANYWSSI